MKSDSSAYLTACVGFIMRRKQRETITPGPEHNFVEVQKKLLGLRVKTNPHSA